MVSKKKLYIWGGLLVLAVVGLPLYTLLSQKPQETRSKASGSTVLELTPQSTQTSPISANTGEVISLDVYVDPGTNLPSIIKLDIVYNQAQLKTEDVPFVINTDAFPSKLEGPIITNGHLLLSVSIGSDSTKAIQSRTKVGTVRFKALSATAEPSIVAFGDKTQVLSIAPQDESSQNVLSTSVPAFLTIVGPTAVPTTIAYASPTYAVQPTVTVVPPTTQPTQEYPTATPAPTFSPITTVLSFTVFIHGIGSSGDNVNPVSDLSNKNPRNPQRPIEIQIYDKQNTLIKTVTGTINYNSTSGTFIGKVDIGTDITEDIYTIKVKEQTHLRRLVPGIVTLKPQTENLIPDITLIAGDINNDNVINILDYNILIGCYSDLLPAVSCTETNKIKADLNDDGNVNQLDYNFFLREVTVQQGG